MDLSIRLLNKGGFGDGVLLLNRKNLPERMRCLFCTIQKKAKFSGNLFPVLETLLWHIFRPPESVRLKFTESFLLI